MGRAADLARLEQTLSSGGTDVVVQAVHGLGGIGKSTLAARYAATHRRDYSVIWWITTDSPAGIDTGLAALAVALQHALAEMQPLEALRERAVAWLASHSGWLVVLDNVTDPGHVRALLGRAPAGRFVITSRRATGWHGIATPLPLDVLAAAAPGSWQDPAQWGGLAGPPAARGSTGRLHHPHRPAPVLGDDHPLTKTVRSNLRAATG